MSSQTPSAAINQYNEATQAMQSAANAYKKELQWVMGLSAGVRLWEFQMVCFPMLIEYSQYQVIQNSDVQNIATDLRNLVTNAQQDFNSITQLTQGLSGNAPTPPTAIADASAMIQNLQELHNLLGMSGMATIIGTANLGSLDGYVSNVYSNFPNTAATSPTSMANDIRNWFASAGAGTASTPQIQSITNQFQDLNQTLSGTSTQAQTEMQYIMNNLQQYLGVYKSNFDTFTQLTSYFIQNSQYSSSS